MCGYLFLKGSWEHDAIREHGRAATAAITSFHAEMGYRQDHTIHYTIDFAWRDASGAERHYGPTHISAAYAQQIAFNGVLATRQTTIRYLEENPSAGAIIVPDADERAAQDEFGRTVTAVLGGIGLVFAGLTAWRTRWR
jgi:hypothetical protein